MRKIKLFYAVILKRSVTFGFKEGHLLHLIAFLVKTFVILQCCCCCFFDASGEKFFLLWEVIITDYNRSYF